MKHNSDNPVRSLNPGMSEFKGLRLTAGRRPTWVCVGLGRAHVKLSGAYWALVVPETGLRRRRGPYIEQS